MKIMKRVALAAAVSAGLFGATGVMAAQDGQLGSSSTGEFDIEFVRNGEIIIKNLEDMTLPDGANSDGDLIAWNNNVCVAATTATDYSITAANTKGNFSLTNTTGTGGETAPYTIHYADGITTPSSVTLDSNNQLDYGSAKTGFTPEQGTDCTTNTSTIWVKLAKAYIPTVDGTYTDTVTLTVAPN